MGLLAIGRFLGYKINPPRRSLGSRDDKYGRIDRSGGGNKKQAMRKVAGDLTSANSGSGDADAGVGQEDSS